MYYNASPNEIRPGLKWSLNDSEGSNGEIVGSPPDNGLTASGTTENTSIWDQFASKMLDFGAQYASYKLFQKDGNTPGVYTSGQPAPVKADTPYSQVTGNGISPVVLVLGGVALLVGIVVVFKLLKK